MGTTSLRVGSPVSYIDDRWRLVARAGRRRGRRHARTQLGQRLRAIAVDGEVVRLARGRGRRQAEAKERGVTTQRAVRRRVREEPGPKVETRRDDEQMVPAV